MRNNTFTLGIVILLCSGWCASTAHNSPLGVGARSGLILEALADKPDYVKGETVELTFKLRNVGHDKVLVARTFQLARYIDLEISDKQGNRARWCGRVISQTDSVRSFTILAPRGSVSMKLAVSCVNGGDPGRAWGYVMENPGDYVIKATYRLPQPEAFFEKFFSKVAVLRGPVSAEPVTIKIK